MPRNYGEKLAQQVKINFPPWVGADAEQDKGNDASVQQVTFPSRDEIAEAWKTLENFASPKPTGSEDEVRGAAQTIIDSAGKSNWEMRTACKPNRETFEGASDDDSGRLYTSREPESLEEARKICRWCDVREDCFVELGGTGVRGVLAGFSSGQWEVIDPVIRQG